MVILFPLFRRILRCFDYATVNHWIGVINFKSRLQFNENYGQGGFTSLQPICIQLACEVCRKQSQACRNECLRRGPIPFASICIHLYPFARCEPGGFETKVEPEEPAEAIFYPICFAILLFIPETSGDNSSDIFEMFTVLFVVLFSFLTQAWENNSWEPSVQNQSGSQNWEEGRSFWHALGPSWTLKPHTIAIHCQCNLTPKKQTAGKSMDVNTFGPFLFLFYETKHDERLWKSWLSHVIPHSESHKNIDVPRWKMVDVPPAQIPKGHPLS